MKTLMHPEIEQLFQEIKAKYPDFNENFLNSEDSGVGYIYPSIDKPHALAFIPMNRLDKYSKELLGDHFSITDEDNLTKLFPNLSYKGNNLLTSEPIKLLEQDVLSKYGIKGAKGGKLLQKVIKNLPDAFYKDFGQLVAYHFRSSEEHFHLLGANSNQNEFLASYLGDNYAEHAGTLGNSCMKHNKCRPWLAFYSDISINDSIRILVLHNESHQVLARALIWTLPDNTVFMDRIYTIDENKTLPFIEYAQKNNMIWKTYQSYNYKIQFNSTTATNYHRRVEYKLPRNLRYYEDFPYIDTFTYSDGEYLYNEEDNDVIAAFTDIYGEYTEVEEENNRVWDDYADEYIDEEDSVYLFNGHYTHQDNAVYINGNYYHNEDSDIFYCDSCGDAGLIEDAIEIDGTLYCDRHDTVYCEKEDKYMFAEDAIPIDGIYYDKTGDMVVYSEDSDEYLLIEDAIEIDGNYYHKDSNSIIFDDLTGNYVVKDTSAQLTLNFKE